MLSVHEGWRTCRGRVSDAVRDARRLHVSEWVNLIEQGRTALERAPAPVQRAIDALVGALPRRWARRWRRTGDGPAAYKAARDEVLATRTRFPGPIFVWEGDGDLQTSLDIRLWGTTVGLRLKHGVPDVARDEPETEKLRELMETTHPQIRVIKRQEAYRPRQKGAR
jgi:hypothetical protein